MRKKRMSATWMLMLVLTSGCGSEPPSEEAPDAGITGAADAATTADADLTPHAVCEHLIDAYANAWVRCERGTYEEGRTWLLSYLRGSCDNIISIDPVEVYGVCDPNLRSWSCQELITNANFCQPSFVLRE